MYDEQHNMYANNLRHLRRTAMAEPKYVKSSASWQAFNHLYMHNKSQAAVSLAWT